MSRLISATMLILFALFLVACGGTGEPAATPADGALATDVVATAPIAEATQPADVTPPAEATVPAATEAAPADATAAPEAEPTAEAIAICGDVPRPALLLSTGDGFDVHNPLSGERCRLPGITEDLGPEFMAGDRLYFMQRDLEASTVAVARLSPDGTVESLAPTQGDGDTYYLMQFAVAPDESRLAWSQSEPQSEDNPMALASTLWIADADGNNATTVFEGQSTADGRIATPVRFSADGQTLFITWQPMGLGGMWNAFSGRYDNLYRLPAAGGEPEKVFDCADQELFLCVGDFRDDGTLAYIDAERTIHVAGPDGAELAAIPTTEEYAGYPTFAENGDLFYSTATLPADDSGVPFPAPGTLHRVAAPYTEAPAVVASAEGLLTAAMPQPFLDANHLVVQYAEGENWGSALLDVTTGTITRLEPWPNAYLSSVWPAN